jgi:tetratricopeptide (TPR) repeat protein
MKSLLAFALVCSFAFTAWPCANFVGKGTKYSGEKSTAGLQISGYIHLRRALQTALSADGESLEAELRNATEFTNRNDYCVALMYLGRSQEAVERLQKLEQEKPGEYYIASNLGTAYELTGNNQEALRWINEGIHRNPASHEGTEWLHAKILESKIAQQKDPAYFEKHSVLELNPAQVGEAMAIDGRTFSSQQVADAIQHQLEERLQFVKPPDPAVASLLFDYAAIKAATKSMESAKGILNLAANYGYPQTKIQALRKDFDRRLAWRKTKDYFTYALFGVLGIGILWLLYKRGIFVFSSKDLKRAKSTL